jgi:hypothetical protein
LGGESASGEDDGRLPDGETRQPARSNGPAQAAMGGVTGDTQRAGLGAQVSLCVAVPDVAASPLAVCTDSAGQIVALLPAGGPAERRHQSTDVMPTQRALARRRRPRRPAPCPATSEDAKAGQPYTYANRTSKQLSTMRKPSASAARHLSVRARHRDAPLRESWGPMRSAVYV